MVTCSRRRREENKPTPTKLLLPLWIYKKDGFTKGEASKFQRRLLQFPVECISSKYVMNNTVTTHLLENISPLIVVHYSEKKLVGKCR